MLGWFVLSMVLVLFVSVCFYFVVMDVFIEVVESNVLIDGVILYGLLLCEGLLMKVWCVGVLFMVGSICVLFCIRLVGKFLVLMVCVGVIMVS